jgi:hypothetical protein
MEDAGIFNDHFVYFSAKWYITFATLCGELVYLFPF